MLCDGGGSISATRYVFREEFHKLATRLGSETRVVHNPPCFSNVEQVYQTGRKCASGFKKSMKIVSDEILPNETIQPSLSIFAFGKLSPAYS